MDGRKLLGNECATKIVKGFLFQKLIYSQMNSHVDDKLRGVDHKKTIIHRIPYQIRLKTRKPVITKWNATSPLTFMKKKKEISIKIWI